MDSTRSSKAAFWIRFWPYLLLLVLDLVFFWDSLFAGKVLYMRDTFCDLFPFRMFTAQAFRDGAIPHWNPYSGFGKPFAADPVSGVFYPLHLLFCVFPPVWAFKISYILHFFIGGAGIFAVARRWKLSVAPALLAAVTFMFNTWMMAWLEFFSAFTAVVWGPWLLFVAQMIVERELKNSKSRPLLTRILDNLPSLVLFAVLVANQYLTGYPEMVLYTLMLAMAFVLASCLYAGDMRALIGSLLTFALAGIIILGLVLPHLLPSMEFLKYSERSGDVGSGAERASFHPGNLLTMIFPFIYGRPGYPQEFWAQSVYEFCLGTCHMGILPLIMALLSFFFWRKRKDDGSSGLQFVSLFWATLAVLGLLMAAGIYTPLYSLVYNMVPFFRHFRWPTKFLVWFMYGISLLAGIGYEAARRDGARNKDNKAGIVCLTFWTVLLLIFSAAYLFSSDKSRLFDALTFGAVPDHHYVWTTEHLRSTGSDYLRGLAFLSVGVLSFAALLFSKIPTRVIDVVVIGATFLNLSLVAREVQFVGSAEVLAAKPDTVKRMEGISQPTIHSNFATAQQYLYGSRDLALWKWAKEGSAGDTWLPYHIRRDWEGGMKHDRYLEMYQLLESLPGPERNRFADILGLNYLLGGNPINTSFADVLFGNADRSLSIAPRDTAVSRCYLASNWELFATPNESLRRLFSPDFDCHHTAVLDATLEYARNPRMAEPPSNGHGSRIISIRDDWNKVSIEAEADRESLLVLNDTWYPGWIATVDGHAQPIQRANLLFRAVVLDAGTHHVEFSYRPRRFQVGLWISMATCAAVGIALLVRSRILLRQRSTSPAAA